MKLAKLQKVKPTIRFSAKLFRPKAIEQIGSWTLLTLPKNASAKLPSLGMATVEGTINGLPFQSALEPDGNGSHRLKLNKAMRDAIRRDTLDIVTAEITRVGVELETRVPSDLREAFKTAPLSRHLWADITPIARRDWIFWIITAKLPKTRKRRIEHACSMLASGKRRVCCFAGIKWLMKNHTKARRHISQ